MPTAAAAELEGWVRTFAIVTTKPNEVVAPELRPGLKLGLDREDTRVVHRDKSGAC